ncbi:MAG: hypothetical protein AABX17_00985 [Nanoarchaeota archaeon]
MELYIDLKKCSEGKEGVVSDGPILGPLESICICGTGISATHKGEDLVLPLYPDGTVQYGLDYHFCMVRDEATLNALNPNWRQRLANLD